METIKSPEAWLNFVLITKGLIKYRDRWPDGSIEKRFLSRYGNGDPSIYDVFLFWRENILGLWMDMEGDMVKLIDAQIEKEFNNESTKSV